MILLVSGLLLLAAGGGCGAVEGLVNITVSQAPKLVDLVDKLNQPESTNATITCSIGSGDTQGLTYDWFKDDQQLVGSRKFNIHVLFDNYQSILRIINLEPEDAGLYSCVARNHFGQDRIAIKLNVKVQLKWLLEPPSELRAPVGRPLQVPCRASGSPEPKVEWRRLDSGQQTSPGSELRFESVAPSDAGLYECRASGGADGEELVARVKLEVLGE